MVEATLQSADTAELVIAARAGERAALGELFERYRPMVVAVIARRLHDSAEVQELSQEVFIQVIKKIDQLRAPEAFGGWIKSIANRMAINRSLRRQIPSATEPRLLENTSIERRTPYTSAVEQERATELRTAVARLRRLDRDTLEAFYLRGQSLREMSVEFNAPVGTIKRRLHVARQRLVQEVSHLVSAG